jgi:RimJ/RimL family protein N-acetyltransferase
MSAVRPEPAALEGRFIRLEPMTPEHYPGLWDALGHPAVFSGGYGGGPEGLPADRDAFIAWLPGYYRDGERNSYALRIVGGPHDGTVVGATSLGDFELESANTHIGWTGYDPRVWATQVNPEAKLLLLGLAFDHGFTRVKLQADARNDRSRGAIAKLGGVFEGISRRDRLRADGTWRDTAVFSIIDEEWPAVRAGLEARLASYGDRPVLFRSAEGLRG